MRDSDNDEDFIVRIYGRSTTGVEIQGFTAYIEPAEMSPAESLQFNYTVSFDSPGSASVQLDFSEPGYVSVTTTPDILVIELKNFTDNEGNLIADHAKIKRNLPNQIGDFEQAEAIFLAAEYAVVAIGSQFTIQTLLTSCSKMKVGELLASMAALQLIIHLTLTKAVIPANAQILFTKIEEIVSFDPIEVSD